MTASFGIAHPRASSELGIPATRDVDAMLVLAAVFSAGFLVPSVAGDFVVADLFIVAMLIVALPSLARGEPQGLMRSTILPLLLILLGSLLGVLAMGVEPWMVRDLLKDVGAFGSLLAGVVLLRRVGPRGLRAVASAAAVATVIVVLLLLAETGLRAAAVFPNPNVAAHYLGANLIVLSRAPISRWLRVTASGFALVGLVVTGSFGALLMVVGAFAYLGATSSASSGRSRLRILVPILLVTVFGIVMVNLPSSTSDTGFNVKHLERSSTGRLGKWTATSEVVRDHPLGIGPGSNRGLGLLPDQQEAHNEYLAYLSERGVVGLAGLIALYGALWLYGAPGGLTRALTIGFALQSLVRETFHYRHVWLLLALAIVLDERMATPPQPQALGPPRHTPGRDTP